MSTKLDVTHLQLIFMGVIFTVTSAAGLSPVLLRRPLAKLLVSRAATRSRMLSCALCFGAGVFLFVCFMGLLPAADSKFHHFLEELGHTDERWEKFAEFPWGFFVVTCGFLIIFTVDKLVHAAEDARRRGSSTTLPATTPTTTISGHHHQLMRSKQHHHHTSSHNEEGGGKGVPSSVMFLVALGTHSVFEGVAVGLQTKADKVLEFAVAVLVHEWVMAFTFGLEVSSNEVLSRCKKVAYILAFTSTIPLGIAVGVGLQNAPSANREIVSAVLEAFATGIFIHIIFIEVLAKEFPAHHSHDPHHYNPDHHHYSHRQQEGHHIDDHHINNHDNLTLSHLNPQPEFCYHHHTSTHWNQQRDTHHNHNSNQAHHQGNHHQYHNHDYQYHNCIHENPLHDQQQMDDHSPSDRLQNDHHLQNQHNIYVVRENFIHNANDILPNHNTHDSHNNLRDTRTSETCLILEKIASICCGMTIMIVLNLFLHTHH